MKAVKVFIGFGILCIVVIYIIFGPYLLVRSIGNVIEYHRDIDHVTEISAVVTNIDESVATEGGSEYSIYVSYNHNGSGYSNVYWKTTDSEADFPIGSTVTVKISENNPDKIFKGAFDRYFSLVFPLFFTILGIFAAIVTYFSINNPKQ